MKTKLLAILAAALAGCSPQGNNILAEKPPGLQNGGFEEGAKSWGEGGLCSNSGMRITVIDTQAHTGKRCLEICNELTRKPNQYVSVCQKIGGVQVGRRYTVRMWIRGKGAAAMCAEWVTNPEWLNANFLPPGTYDWTPYEFDFTADTNPVPLRLISENTGVVWIDDISVEEAKTTP